jgi:queuine tRNA-ribosyltransferase
VTAGSPLQFTITHRDPATAARRGVLQLPHGQTQTPAFMPVGTAATVKGMTPRELRDAGAEMILANTYHLALRPGAEVIKAAGGLHRFMGWEGPILTDSGGFQVFSLSASNQVSDDGVAFRSQYDGDLVHLSPERAVALQNDLGADVIMALDECPALPCDRGRLETAVERTARWAERSLRAHRRADQAMFGIVQGGVDEELRRRSVSQVTSLDFPGYAIGGVSVGETPADMQRAVAVAAPLLPADRPRYLMGVGRPEDIVDMVALGIDLFDCVLPTRNARNAYLFTSAGPLRMRNAALARDFGPVDPTCGCYTCRTFSRAYLRHLYTAGEMLAGILGTIHNLAYFQALLARIRDAIAAGRYAEFQKKMVRE